MYVLPRERGVKSMLFASVLQPLANSLEAPSETPHDAVDDATRGKGDT